MLQEQSQRPSFPDWQVDLEVHPYATTLDSLIKANDSCTTTMFYMTWGRRYGDASNCAVWPPVCTYEGMQERLRMAYLEMGDRNAAEVAPVGIAWKNAMEADSTIVLYNGDNSHPNYTGSYLTACVFYASMYRKTPVGLGYYGSLDTATAQFLQGIAGSTVLDSLETWGIGRNDIGADFTHSAVGTDVNFTDLSNNAKSWTWNFGDGDSSTLQNPSHTYPSIGTWVAELIVSDGCGNNDTILDTLNLSLVGIQDPLFSYDLVHSNGNILAHIQLPQTGSMALELLDLSGKVLWNSPFYQPSNRSIHLPEWHLSQGLYLLSIKAGENRKVLKLKF